MRFSPHDSPCRFAPSYNDRIENNGCLQLDPGTRRHRAAITEMHPVLYIFALERAVESRNRVLENQLLVTVRGGEMPERAILFFPYFFLSRSPAYTRAVPLSAQKFSIQPVPHRRATYDKTS